MPSNDNDTGQLIRAGSELRLSGRINLSTVPGLYRQIRRELVPGITGLDCSGIEDGDSAAVGLLLACVRIARGQEFSLQIKGMGPQILSLARLYDVDRILQPDAEGLAAGDEDVVLEEDLTLEARHVLLRHRSA